MAGIDVGGGKKRSVDADVNMIPFIDLLLVTVAFLLITAVWTTNSRLNANAQLPGETGPTPEAPSKMLHVHVHADTFTLSWQQGSLVVSQQDIVKSAGDHRYDALREAIAKEYRDNGVHHNVDDFESDRAILHTPDNSTYGEIIEVMDAVASAKREVRDGDRVAMVPAFSPTFAIR